MAYFNTAQVTDGLISNEYNCATDSSPDVVTKNYVNGSEIMFHELHYSVNVKKGCKSADKEVLKDCSGIMKPGLNAILGPTGSGKTTLLNILAGRIDKNRLSGIIFINGEVQSPDFHLASGFVSQDDIVMGTLTVRENLCFSAALRLPDGYNSYDRNARVDMIINELGLATCSESRVGNDEVRGISGGERKRTNIGMELIIQPEILFLDEPTTGLDAATASTVITILKRLAENGKTIIFSIHQPRYAIFKLFDDVTLLGSGEMIFKGPATHSLEYFKNLGYHCDVHNNPADFLLDIICEEAKSKHTLDGLVTEEHVKTISFAEQFHQSTYHQSILENINATIEQGKVNQPTFRSTSVSKYARSFIRQAAIISRRNILNLVRDPRTLTTQVMVNLLYALVVGGIYWQIGKGTSGVQDRVGVFFFMITNMVFANMSAIALFIKERCVFRHECANGYYCVSAYFIAKILCDTIPMRVIPILIFSVITYFMIGLQLSVVKFFIYTLTLLLTSLSAAGVCILVSSSIELIAVANLLASVPFVFMMLFSGLLINLKNMTVWIRWLKYLSIVKYGLSSLEINELHGLELKNSSGFVIGTGDGYLEENGIKVDELWWNELALGCITLSLLTLTYIQLRRMKKHNS